MKFTGTTITHSAKDYLLTFASYTHYLKLLPPEKIGHRGLYEWLIKEKDTLSDDNKRLPTMKDLGGLLKTNPSKLTKMLVSFYDEIFNLNYDNPSLFCSEKQIPCSLYFKSYFGSCAFDMGLNHIPRVNESFMFPFLKNKLSSESFYVNEVTYSIKEDGQEVIIDLTSEQPNLYLSLLKEKAYLRHAISWSDLMGYGDKFDVKEKLLKRYDNL